jgi:arylsulfatase A-like enzyme
MNLLDNTIVIFTSDNGGSIPKKPVYPENKADEYGLKINGDFRGSKTLIYEGGTRVPLIVSWPGRVQEGTVSNDMVNLVDVFATVCDITDGNLPESKDVAPDSYSFLPSLLNKTNQHPRTSMVTADASGMHALRDGNWKYIDNTPPEGLPADRLEKLKDFKPQLYNLEEDPAESNNLYKENQDVVIRLKEKLNQIREANYTR